MTRAIPDAHTGEQELQWEIDGMNIYISTKADNSNGDIGTTRKISIFHPAAYVVNDKRECRRLQFSTEYTLDSTTLDEPTAQWVKVVSLRSTHNILPGRRVIDETKPSDTSETIYDQLAHEDLMGIICRLEAEDGFEPES
jgi:hypothetical protein